MKNQSILFLDEVDSTNRYALEHFDDYPDGTLIAAETQTAGRGRLGRRWVSPAGNVYASFLVKRPFGEPFHATVLSSLAVLAASREEVPDSGAYIKWPNDVFVGARKLSGILCEGVIRNGSLSGVVCGIGINVNLSAEDLASVGQPAVSLGVLANRKIPLKNFIKRLAFFLNKYYITGITACPELFSLWKTENRVIGKEVLLVPSSGIQFRATVLDIAGDGTLRIRKEDKTEEFFACGDVKLASPEGL